MNKDLKQGSSVKSEISPADDKPMLAEVLDREYPIIPMSEIDEEAREIAIRWAGESGMDWIGDKHKLASDIMNYARRCCIRNITDINKRIHIDNKIGVISNIVTNDNNIVLVYVDFDTPNRHFKIYTLEDILKIGQDTRKNFCLWYYAQSQPLDAHKIVDWFVSNFR